jgi:AbrB family looped-hinge helix DNA binding protein
MATATVTAKGQVTIPKQIRKLLLLDRGSRVEFTVDKAGAVSILPITSDVTELKRMISTPEKYVSIEDMNNAGFKTCPADQSWDDWFDAPGVSDDFMEERKQPR